MDKYILLFVYMYTCIIECIGMHMYLCVYILMFVFYY